MSDFFEDAVTDMAKDEEQQQLAENAETWDPKPGDLLRAVFLSASTVVTQYGPSILAIVKDLDTEEGLKIWCSRTVLKNEIIEAAPAPGTLLAIKYIGEQESKDGSFTYHLYQVRAQQQDREYWNKVQLPDILEDAPGRARQVSPEESLDRPPVHPNVNPNEAPF